MTCLCTVIRRAVAYLGALFAPSDPSWDEDGNVRGPRD